MTNLWDEIIDILKEHDKTFEDVRFIQGYDFKITKENFEQVAKKLIMIADSVLHMQQLIQSQSVKIGGQSVENMTVLNGGNTKKVLNKLMKLEKSHILQEDFGQLQKN